MEISSEGDGARWMEGSAGIRMRLPWGLVPREHFCFREARLDLLLEAFPVGKLMYVISTNVGSFVTPKFGCFLYWSTIVSPPVVSCIDPDWLIQFFLPTAIFRRLVLLMSNNGIKIYTVNKYLKPDLISSVEDMLWVKLAEIFLWMRWRGYKFVYAQKKACFVFV